MMTKNKRLTAILVTVVLLLCVPLFGMLLNLGFDWTIFDFLVAAVLLFGTGLLIEFVLRKVKTQQNRIILVAIILVVLFLVWAELAVGIFGTPLAGS